MDPNPLLHSSPNPETPEMALLRFDSWLRSSVHRTAIPVLGGSGFRLRVRFQV